MLLRSRGEEIGHSGTRRITAFRRVVSLSLSWSLTNTHPYLFMCLLSISSVLYHSHDNVLGGHEWKFLTYATSNDFRVHNQAFGYVLQRSKNNVCGQERFRQSHSAIRTVCQVSIEIHTLSQYNANRTYRLTFAQTIELPKSSMRFDEGPSNA